MENSDAGRTYLGNGEKPYHMPSHDISFMIGWWFQTLFIFRNIWDNPSHLPIFFKMVKTTNQLSFENCLQTLALAQGNSSLFFRDGSCDDVWARLLKGCDSCPCSPCFWISL